MTFLGTAYLGLGRIEEATALLEECVSQNDRLGLGANASVAITRLGEAYLAAGRRDEALSIAERALARCLERKERGQEAWVLHLMARIAEGADVPDSASAKARYEEALAIARERELRPLMAHCDLGLAGLYARTGDLPAAESRRAVAAAAFRALDMSWPGVQGEREGGR